MKQTEIEVILAQLRTTHEMDSVMDGSYSAEWAIRKFEPLLELGYSYEEITTYIAIKLQELTIKDVNFAKKKS